MKKIKILIIAVLLVLLTVSGGCTAAKSTVITSGSPEAMYANAIALYNSGDVDNATYQMSLYIDVKSDDSDAMRLLSSWFTELGKPVYAVKYIQMANQNTDIQSDSDLVLSKRFDSALVCNSVDGFDIKISPLSVQSSNAVLTVTGKNLFSGDYESNSCIGTASNGWRTSQWFSVDSNAHYLTISGGFNRAVWQFKLENGEHVLSGDNKKVYRVSNSNSVKNVATATVEIPANAISCRIAYAYEGDAESDSLDERIQIEYGRFPSDYVKYSSVEIALPDLLEGSYLTYDGGTWKSFQNNSETTISLQGFTLNKGDTISLTSELTTVAEINVDYAKTKTDGIYGVKWSNDSTSILLERTDDAVGLSFNYLYGEDFAGAYENDFDNIYPWCDIKFCAIDDSGAITYDGDANFATDGSAGNVFVEIPKHYIKRQVVGNEEYLAISATPHDGFELDPSFKRGNGEVDHIYVASYLTSIQSDKATSVSGKVPNIAISMDEATEAIKSIGNNYQEIDVWAVMTIQRLFLIETAVRDSQAFWTGNCNLSYFQQDPASSDQYAVSSAPDSNTITISDSALNRRFKLGDAVSISTFDQFFGERKYDNYYSRIITDVKNGDSLIYITFDGDGINVKSGVTQISHVIQPNGSVDNLKYHSGSYDENNGLTSFRYRFMENLWGDGFIIVDGVKVKETTITVLYPDNRVAEISYNMALQPLSPGQTDTVDYSVMNITCMGFDPDNPFIMLPSAIDGSMSTAFCDTLYTGFADGWKDKTVQLLWGGTWDLRNSCGLFCYRFIATKSDNLRENGSRMMHW